MATVRKSQWWTPVEILGYQRQLLERLLRHAATQTAFYPDRLAPLFSGGDAASAPIDFSRWNEIPIIGRGHAIDYLDGMTARQTPQDTGDAVAGATSGTTGRSLRHLKSRVARIAESCAMNRVYEVFGLDLSGSMAFIITDKENRHPYPDGSQARGWNLTDENSALYVLDVGTTAEQRLDWLERIRPDHVSSYPSRMLEVASLAAESNSTLRFKTLIASGEPLDPVTADRLVEAFGCEIIDIYAAREIGLVAFECPDAAGFHVASEAVFVEVVDEHGAPVAPGAFGRVILTALYNYAMPFIRYEVGDYAMPAAAPCLCKRGLPKLDRIGGRSRAAFVLPDGSHKRLLGRFVNQIAERLAYREIQLVQTEIGTIEVRYVPYDDTPPDIEGLTSLFRSEFHPDIALELRPVERIPRTAGMKLEQFVSLLI